MTERKKPIRILQILNRMDYGGIEAVVMNYYLHMDTQRVQFDFAVNGASELPQKEQIEKRGGRIYLLPQLTALPDYIRELSALIRRESYTIVHCHMSTLNIFPLFAAKLGGAKVRICHNHSTAHIGEGKKTILKYMLRPCSRLFATDYFACGEYAGRWMYGNKNMDAGNVYVMRNAIDTEKYSYKPAVRAEMRKKLGVEDKFVVGHIGRFMYQKNHAFLIDIFAELHKRRNDAVLLLVGEGELEQQIRDKVKQLGLGGAVFFYGTSEDTSRVYQVMDAFCLPSFYEGVPVVAVEAQACGVPVTASDAVAEETGFSDSYTRLPLSAGAVKWADVVGKQSGKMEQSAVKEEYVIQAEVERLEKWYEGRMYIERGCIWSE